MNQSQRILARLFERDGTPRERALWLVFAGIVASQLLAFFVVCVHQVERAQARHVEARTGVVNCGVAAAATLQCASQTADATPSRDRSRAR